MQSTNLTISYATQQFFIHQMALVFSLKSKIKNKKSLEKIGALN